MQIVVIAFSSVLVLVSAGVAYLVYRCTVAK